MLVAQKYVSFISNTNFHQWWEKPELPKGIYQHVTVLLFIVLTTSRKTVEFTQCVGGCLLIFVNPIIIDSEMQVLSMFYLLLTPTVFFPPLAAFFPSVCFKCPNVWSWLWTKSKIIPAIGCLQLLTLAFCLYVKLKAKCVNIQLSDTSAFI